MALHHHTKAERKKMMRSKKTRLSKAKAKKMLKEGVAHGRPLTKKQRKFFGLIAGGGKVRKLKKKKRK